MKLLTLDLDTLRFVLVASVVAGFIVYSRWNLSAGGMLTGGYLVMLSVFGQWQLIIAIVVVAALTLAVVRGVMTRALAFPKEWTYVGFITTSTVLMSIMTLASKFLGPLPLPGGIEFVLLVGSFITPGLLAYDIAHQGIRSTIIGLGLVIGIMLIVTVPVVAVADLLQPESATPHVGGFGQLPAGLYWLATLAAVLISGALRLSYAIRAGGFIGPLFIAGLLSLDAFITIYAAAIAAYWVTRFLARRITMSPRQMHYVAMLVGMMAAWTGLYWASLVGWLPALAANSYALQPLLAVGLLASDMSRPKFSAVTSLLGSLVTVGFIVLVMFAASGSGWPMWISTPILVVAIPALIALPAFAVLRRSWSESIDAGRKVSQTLLNRD